MEAKEAIEEFIRRESKTEPPKAELLQYTKETPTTKYEEDSIPDSESEPLEEECKRITRTEFDAVHPRFQEPQKPEVIEAWQIANDYYCEQCKLFFAPTVLGLQTHFKGDMVQHRPIDDCFYCNGPVYAYTFNRERQIYHNCADSKSK